MKKRIIKIIIILLITIAFIGVAVYLTTGFLNKREVKQDIETTLDSIKAVMQIKKDIFMKYK